MWDEDSWKYGGAINRLVGRFSNLCRMGDDNKEINMPSPLFSKVDCIRLSVQDLDSGIAFYRNQ